MPTISPPLPNDGESIDASDVNVPFNQIVSLLNGQLDLQNIKPGSLNWTVMSDTNNRIPSTSLEDAANAEKFRKDAKIYFVVEGMIWSPLNGLNASMTAGKYFASTGKFLDVQAISSKEFQQNRDTYVYVNSNGTMNYNAKPLKSGVPPSVAGTSLLARVTTDSSRVTHVDDLRQLYALNPHNISPGLVNYSKVEQFTGQYWHDNKPIYKKTLEWQTNGSGVEQSFKDDIFDKIDTLINFESAVNTTNGERYPNGYTNPSAPSLQYFQAKLAVLSGNNRVLAYNTKTAGTAHATLWYTRWSE